MEFKEIEKPQQTKLWKYGACYQKKAEGYILHIQPVIFGFRVALIKEGTMLYELNLCAGDQLYQISLLYTITERILSQANDEQQLHKLIDQIPNMEVRPFYKDPTWLVRYCKLANEDLSCFDEIDFIKLDPEILTQSRERSFNPTE